jgi:multiple sugar transport system permease protein
MGKKPVGAPGERTLLQEIIRNWQSYLFIAPLIIFFLLLNSGALVASFGLSFTKWSPGGIPKWLGLTNYIRLFQDDLFWIALRNTAVYSVIVIGIGIPLALIMALALDSGIPFRGYFLVSFYMPAVVSTVVMVVLWRWMLHPTYGMVNQLLGYLGVPPVYFLGDAKTALATVASMALWGFGPNMVLFLAGLQGIPRELQEAAMIDGANAWQRFWRVTLPLLRPTVLYIMVLGTVGALQVFEQVQLLPTPGGPLNSTTTATFFIWQQAFRYVGRMGYASAAAFILGALIIVLAFAQQRAVGTEDVY